MKKTKKDFLTKAFLILLILGSLFFTSGQEGCSPENGTAKKTGIDFSLISKTGMLTGGRTLETGETFFIGVKIENYDKKERQVTLCITDTMPPQYGGIPTEGYCQEVFLPAAEVVKKNSQSAFGSSNTEQLSPGTKEVLFPEQGQFSYSGLPKMNQPFSSSIVLTARYLETNTATTTVYVPDEEQPPIVQEPSQIMVTLEKSVYTQGNAYKVNLDLNLIKNPSSNIFLPDFLSENENKTFFNSRLAGKSLDCRTTNNQPITNILEIKDSKTIRCSTLLYQGAQRQDYDFVATLIYGVQILKSYNFYIDTSQTI